MKDVMAQGRGYNDERAYITWEKCSLRKWLNEDFYNTFTPEEQARIMETHLKNPDSEEFGTNGGKDTDDKIFLLSIDEIEEYMAKSERSASYWWWLRSPGGSQYGAAGCRRQGDVAPHGDSVSRDGGIRPALNLKF